MKSCVVVFVIPVVVGYASILRTYINTLFELRISLPIFIVLCANFVADEGCRMKCRNTGFCVLSSCEANAKYCELKHEGTFKLLKTVKRLVSFLKNKQYKCRKTS